MEGGVYRVTVQIPEGTRPSERFRRKLENNIKINFKEIEPDSVHWCVLFQNKNKFWEIVNAIMNLTFARNVGKFFSICEPPSQERLCCVVYLFIYLFNHAHEHINFFYNTR